MKQRIRNSVYGMALGDAIGYGTEFEDFTGAGRLYTHEANRAELLITDDTQMSIALVEGVRQALRDGETDPRRFIPRIAQEFADWSVSPENTRAPGNACMDSLASLRATGKPIHLLSVEEATRHGVKGSKGSGTVMRSPWIGLLDIPDNDLRAFCHLQSEITHHHPTALEASYVAALITRKLSLNEIAPAEVMTYAAALAEENLRVNPNQGWAELMEKFRHILRHSAGYGKKSAFEEDPSLIAGAAYTAEDVLGTALLVISAFPKDPVEVLKRCAISSGDSDTVGAVAGGIIGAAFDGNPWAWRKDGIPHEGQVERAYLQRLDAVVVFLSANHS